MDVLCTDKELGTLTQDKIYLSQHIDFYEKVQSCVFTSLFK